MSAKSSRDEKSTDEETTSLTRRTNEKSSYTPMTEEERSALVAETERIRANTEVLRERMRVFEEESRTEEIRDTSWEGLRRDMTRHVDAFRVTKVGNESTSRTIDLTSR